MTRTVLLGLTLVAVLAMAVAFPAVADAITSIKKTEIKVKGDEIKKLKFKLEDKLPKSVFGGYGIFTDGGAVVAITSHPGFYDSEAQKSPKASQVDLQISDFAAVCNVTKKACGNEWHSHLVEAVTSPFCGFAAIGELTWDEPAKKVKTGKKHVEAKNIDIGDKKFTGALDGVFRDFTVGTPIEGGAAFDLVPSLAVPGDISTLQDVCIVPTP